MSTNYLNVSIKNIKNIKSLKLEIPIEKGVYSIVGSNGSGKSTIMLALSQLVRKSSLKKLSPLDYQQEESKICFTYLDHKDNWFYDAKLSKWVVLDHQPEIHFDGFYEGSIFYGTRFSDASRAESLLIDTKTIDESLIVDADNFIIEQLSMIMHDDKEHYKELKRIKNRNTAKNFDFKGIPYFYKTQRGYISQLAMSSGECMLITLLHFVYHVLVRKNYKRGSSVLLLIDEVELALHPKAISRLISFMEYLVKEYGVIIIFSSHSSEVIRRIRPQNLFLIENEDGMVGVTNPCYPSYAIRDLYSEDGFDYLLLVEDELSKKFVNSIINKNNLSVSKLLHVLPAGDWYSSLRLQNEIYRNKVLGVGKKVICLLDGDVIDLVSKKDEFKGLKKIFLPIKSVEKYLYSRLIANYDRKFVKFLGDKYFRVRLLTDILNDYKRNYDIEKDKNGKKLYKLLISNLYELNITEEQFLNYFCQDLLSLVDTRDFESKLINELT